MWRKGEPHALLVRCKRCSCCGNSTAVPQKLKIELPYHPATWYSPKENKIQVQKYMHTCVHGSIIYNSYEMKATQVFLNRWMNKRDVCVCVCACASPVAQMVKNLPAIQETQVQSLGQEDPLGKRIATHSSILAWRTPQTEEPGRQATVHEATKSWTWLSD